MGTLPMKDAKAIVADPPICPYCDKKIPYREISIDHVEARSRGGSSAPENLVYCDRRCNQAKGNLNGTEFKALMAFLNEWPAMKESVLGRLIAGGARYGRRRR
jgi:5-methylcytosine-specific restriction endonuclease McrA